MKSLTDAHTTLHVLIDWIARGLWRQRLAGMWPEITRVQFMEFPPRLHPIGISRPTTIAVCWSRGQPANLRAGPLY